MFTKIVAHEVRSMLREPSFIVLAAAYALLLAFSIYNGATWVRDRQEESNSRIEAQEKIILEKARKIRSGYQPKESEPATARPDDPYSIGMSLQYAVLPFTPGASLSTGQADVLPIDAGVTMSTLQRTQADKDGFENPLGFLAGKFDPSFVLVYLLPLVILALSFNVLSGERESGTLHLLLSNPLGLARLISAKMTAQMAIIYLITSTVIAAGLAIAGGIYQEDLGLRIGLTLVIVFGYSLFWFALASMVNVLGHSSATNAVVCSAMWLLFVLIAPTLINVAVSAVYPVPSRNETISAAREINLDTRRDGSRLLAEHYQDHPEMMPKEGKANLNDFGLAFVLIQSEQKKKVDAVEDRFSAQLARQQELVTRLRFLSPSIVAQEAANDIAGTGLDRYQRFRKQVKEFDQTWSNFFAPRIYRQEQLTTADFEQIPRFRFDEESDRSLAVRVGGSALFLLLISGTLFGIASNRMAVYRFDQ